MSCQKPECFRLRLILTPPPTVFSLITGSFWSGLVFLADALSIEINEIASMNVILHINVR